MPAVYSMHWNNISKLILESQKAVFEALGVQLIQDNADKTSHGKWMNEVVERHQPDDVVVFCDIDAFPLSRAAYERAVASARRGAVFGLAQFSNHKDTQDLYAGPMFMAFKKSTWEQLGRPSLERSKAFDAAEALSVQARKTGSGLDLVRPTSCLIPKWALADQGIFGIGTFYGECEFFHLFESRLPAHEQLFQMVAADVIAGRKLDFSAYLRWTHSLDSAGGEGRAKSRRGLRRVLSWLSPSS